MSDEPHATSSSDGRDGRDESDETEPNTNDRPRPCREGTAPDRGDAAAVPRGDDEPLEYRLERLRLWRTVVTLAIVIARLIRSL